MKHILLLSTSALVLALSACSKAPAPDSKNMGGGPNASEVASAQYTCAMHPHYTSTDPDGSCPICGMDLVPAKTSTAVSSTSGEREILYYKHPMGQPVTSDVPKKDSMGMDYIPVYSDEAAQAGVVVSPEMIQTMGIRTAPAEVMNFGRSLRAFGTVETNERLENVAVSRLEGWIEDLTIRAEGDSVRPGSLLYRIYSPDLISAQKDYLNALMIGNTNRIASVRQRLRSLGMQPITIDRLTETRKISERVPVYAEAGGTVATLQVREGDYVKPGTAVLRLQSYVGVWVMASIPETELPLIDTGMPVTLAFPSAPDAPSEGRMDYIYPTIDPKTRTARVRIEVDNTAGYLRPGAYADISMDLGGQHRLAVPSEAILRDSQGAHVVIALGEGRFEGRAVRTGLTANALTEIISGLTPGEVVVSSGQFLLDSEASLREGLSKFKTGAEAAPKSETSLSSLSIDPETLAKIDHFTDMALYIHDRLMNQSEINPNFLDPAIALTEPLKQQFAGTRLVPILDEASTALRAAQTAREGPALSEALAVLMVALEPWLVRGAPEHYREAGLVLYQDNVTGNGWLQEGDVMRNPYGSGPAENIPWPDAMPAMSMTPSDTMDGPSQPTGS